MTQRTKITITIKLDVEDTDMDGLHDILQEMPNDLRATFSSYDMNLKGCEIHSDPDPRKK